MSAVLLEPYGESRSPSDLTCFMYRFVRPLFTVLTVAFGLVAFQPQPAHACMWNWGEGFSPLPECDIEDQPARKRLQQENSTLLAKITGEASRIVAVKQEIAAWNEALETAKNFEKVLKETFGDITANPLPSLVAEFNRERPLGRSIRLSSNGGLQVHVDAPVDIKALGDSLLRNLAESRGLEELYGMPLNDIPEALSNDLEEDLENELYGTGHILDRRLKQLVDLQEAHETFMDSLTHKGERTSVRYAGFGRASGESESEISHFSSSMSALKGTSYEAKLKALSQRFSSFHAAIRKRERVQEDAAYYSTLIKP